MEPEPFDIGVFLVASLAGVALIFAIAVMARMMAGGA